MASSSSLCPMAPSSSSPQPAPVFLPAAALSEHGLLAAFARAEELAEGEVGGLETRGQARAFLMELYGTVERAGAGAEDAAWHRAVLQAGLHLLQVLHPVSSPHPVSSTSPASSPSPRAPSTTTPGSCRAPRTS